MKNLFGLSTREPEDAKLRLVVEIGLASSAMMRLFERDSSKTLKEKILAKPRAFEAESEDQYKSIHKSICDWGTKNIKLAKGHDYASYGQIAKTLDVAMKVIVYDCHYPDCRRYSLLSKWLNAAVDTIMMAHLKATYPEEMNPWPTTLKQVDERAYASIQEIVRKFIQEKHHGTITPVQFDDMYWDELNRQPVNHSQ